MTDEVLVDGVFVNAEVERVALAIKDYEPRINIQWIPPGERWDENGDLLPAFKLTYVPEDGEPYILFFVHSEEEFNLRVLQRIIVNDQRTTGKQNYDDIRAAEYAAKLIERQRAQDELEEAEDMAYHILKSPLNTYTVDRDLVIKSGIPFNARLLRD